MKQITIFYIIPILLFFNNCNKYQYPIHFTIPTKIVNLYEDPSFTSNIIEEIKPNNIITINRFTNETIFYDNQYGKWASVIYNNKKGWAFSGYLRTYNINDLKPKLVHYYRKIRSNSPDIISEEYKNKILNQNSNDIKFEKILGDVVVVSYLGYHYMHSFTRLTDIWYYNSKHSKWSPFTTSFMNEAYSNVIYLNNDSFPDIIINYGCCTSLRVKVFLGCFSDDCLTNDKNIFKQIYSKETGGNNEIFVNGPCEKTSILSDENTSSDKYYFVEYYFDCKENIFKVKK